MQIINVSPFVHPVETEVLLPLLNQAWTEAKAIAVA